MMSVTAEAAVLVEMERRALLQRIEAECRARHGDPLPAGIEAAVDDYMRLQQMKQEYADDVRMRGVTETVMNGKQKFRRENKSVLMISKLAAEQVKLLKAIGLVRASRASGGEAEEEGEEENPFDTF